MFFDLELFDVFIETQSKLVLWHLKPLVKKVQNQFFWCLRTLVKVYIHVPYHYPLVSGVPKSENFFSTYKWVEGFFNSQIHVGRCFQTQAKTLECFGWVWEGSEVVFQGLMTSSCTYMVFTDKFTL
jgi:hypothetical protein